MAINLKIWFQSQARTNKAAALFTQKDQKDYNLHTTGIPILIGQSVKLPCQSSLKLCNNIFCECIKKLFYFVKYKNYFNHSRN